jgi:PAS domain S-box-containing protein
MREWMKVPPRPPGAVRSFVSAVREGDAGGDDSFQALFEASPLPLVVSALDTGEVLAMNAVAETLSGYAFDDLRGRTVFDFGHYRDAADRAAQLAAVDASPSAGREVRLTNGRGQDLHLLAHTSRIRLDGRDCLLTAFTNVTGLGRIDDGLLAAQRMEVIGKLSGGVAHEFNNLLTVMQGHLDAMAEDTLPEGLRARVDVMRVAQATRITSGLLTFSGRNPTAPSVIDLNAALDGLRSLITGTLGETIDVQWRLDATPSSANMAHTHVAQVVLNLALNAREAMPDGGRLAITTAYLTEAPAADGVAGNGPWVRLQVDDTGHGMTDDVRRHAFEPFFTTKGPGRGTGLGLSICRGIAEQAGGHISVHSVPGEGTSVRLYLPWAQAPDRAPAVTRPAVRTGSKVILLVEDEADVRHIVAEILRRAGHVVHQADGLASAEALFDGLPSLDLLLTDLVLPGGNGLEVARRVRARFAGVPVLFMSGYSESVFAGGESVEHLLQKPFTSRTLLDTLDALLHG